MTDNLTSDADDARQRARSGASMEMRVAALEATVIDLLTILDERHGGELKARKAVSGVALARQRQAVRRISRAANERRERLFEAASEDLRPQTRR